MKGKTLSMEDRVLWGKVARSAVPLPGKAAEAVAPEEEDFAELLDPSPPSQADAAAPREAAPQVTARPPAQNRIDVPTRQKLAKGRLPIEGKVDLHGLTQSEAHALLLSFLRRAQADGRRHVLVVTGKGSSSGGDGILRRMVPVWFTTVPFRSLVGGHEQAARRHGAEGALYVRVRRMGGAP